MPSFSLNSQTVLKLSKNKNLLPVRSSGTPGGTKLLENPKDRFLKKRSDHLKSLKSDEETKT